MRRVRPPSVAMAALALTLLLAAVADAADDIAAKKALSPPPPPGYDYDATLHDPNRNNRDAVLNNASVVADIADVINPMGAVNPYVVAYHADKTPSSNNPGATKALRPLKDKAARKQQPVDVPMPAGGLISKTEEPNTPTTTTKADATSSDATTAPTTPATTGSSTTSLTATTSTTTTSTMAMATDKTTATVSMLEITTTTTTTATATLGGSGFLSLFTSGSLIRKMRHAMKAIDGIVFALTFAVFHIYGRERCQAVVPPAMYRFQVVPRIIPTPTPTAALEDDDLALSKDGNWNVGSDAAKKKRSSDVANPMPTSVVPDTKAPSNYADDMFIEVRTDNLEWVKTWGETAPTDSMMAAHPSALVVTLKRGDADADAVTGLGDNRLLQAMLDYLRELQAIQDRRRHDQGNPGRNTFGESEWLTEDTVWPPDNIRLIDAGYHVDALTLHDNMPTLFDPKFALPMFMRPKAVECQSQAVKMTATSTLIVVLYIVLHLLF